MPGPAKPAGSHGVVFIGFDASEPLIDALTQGKIQGLVVQNPLMMGETSVKTIVKHLEKQPVEAKIATGETLVTPENYKETADRQADPSAPGGECQRRRACRGPRRRSGK